VGLSLIAAACGGDDDDSTSTEAPETTEASSDTTAPSAETTAPEETTAPGDTTETTEGGGEGGAAMTVTYEIADDANWDDGTPITAADFQCTWNANLNTPGSYVTTGYNKITSVEPGASDKEVIVSFSEVYAPYKNLFSQGTFLKADAFEDCNDVSEAFGPEGITWSGREWKLDSWSAEQIVYVPNENYTGPRKPSVDKVVIVPAEDGATALKAGTVDFIFPQAYTGVDQELSDPNVAYDTALSGQYEGFYFQQADGPFADDIFREAFFKSIDLDGVYQQIYAPFAQGVPLLDCGPITNPQYCDPLWTDTYDPEGAAQLLTDNGWTQNGDGMWEKDGEAPEIRFMVSSPNPRREGTQEFLIPKLTELGFNVRADNCEAVPCVFQTRLPGLDYDFSMYINVVAPDPSYLAANFSCEQVPSEENEFQGANYTGWCDEAASDLLNQADRELDEAKRTEMVKEAIKAIRDQYVFIPLLAFPNIGAYRTDLVGNTQGELANYAAFNDWYQWEDLNGDGQIVIGAEQFPTNDCPNPITECASSSWFNWTVANPVMPAAFYTTNDQKYEISEMLASEPVVTTA
jgi:peptide/nickel transport system substrate-binding protein